MLTNETLLFRELNWQKKQS